MDLYLNSLKKCLLAAKGRNHSYLPERWGTQTRLSHVMTQADPIEQLYQ